MTSLAGDQPCPACGAASRSLLAWDFSGLGDSVFNYIADYRTCDRCGLVYVSNIDDAQLARFYAEECGYSENAHFDISSPANQLKYAAYREALVSYGLAGRSIADIGCGRGGFLQWLRQSGWQGTCVGVDVDAKSIPAAEAGGVGFERGGALALPFGDGTCEVLTYFHVLEHVRDTDRLLHEARRVLKPGGGLLLEVPDAERYAEHTIGTAFWVSIREHVYHFSSCALTEALNRHGFSIRAIIRQVLPTPEFSYPSLMVLAEKCTDSAAQPAVCTKGDIAAFCLDSRRALLEQAHQVSALIARHGRITLWGCSAALFSLLPLIDMERVTLCDSSKAKQRNGFRHYRIRDPGDVRREGVLVIAPYLHGEAIMRAARALGWPPGAIVRLE